MILRSYSPNMLDALRNIREDRSDPNTHDTRTLNALERRRAIEYLTPPQAALKAVSHYD